MDVSALVARPHGCLRVGSVAPWPGVSDVTARRDDSAAPFAWLHEDDGGQETLT